MSASLFPIETCLSPGVWMIDGHLVTRLSSNRLWAICGPCDEFGTAKTLAAAKVMIRNGEVPPRPDAPDLTAAEAATVARFDAAPDAEESLRERVARAICRVDYPFGFDDGFRLWADSYRDRADAAIAVMRGDDA